MQLRIVVACRSYSIAFFSQTYRKNSINAKIQHNFNQTVTIDFYVNNLYI